MKTSASNGLTGKRGASRLWIGLGVVAGAAIAYLADPERGGARRRAALQQISGAAQAAAERTSRWRSVVSARFAGQAREQLPEQIDLPVRVTAVSTEAARTDPYAAEVNPNPED